MSKIEQYREKLRRVHNWEPFLRRNSGLPGPRGNLELAHAVALEADWARAEQLLLEPGGPAAENTPGVFLIFCGVLCLGRRVSQGQTGELVRLRQYAADSRWRVREATVIALQGVGDHNIQLLIAEMRRWARGNWYEKRASAAALAEPRLLRDPRVAKQVLRLLHQITVEITLATDSSAADFRVLRQSMGYCWSVVVAASPEEGKPALERWFDTKNSDVKWLMRQNLAKRRLARVDRAWVEASLARLK
jgi:hypothetical protein